MAEQEIERTTDRVRIIRERHIERITLTGVFNRKEAERILAERGYTIKPAGGKGGKS